MKKLTLLIAFAAGYVLGAKAGRGRYEQIKSGAQKVAENPRVQAAAENAKDVAKEKAGDAVAAAKEKVEREASISPTP